MDPLSQTIALLRPRGLLWKQVEARGDWAVRFPTHDGAAFCQVVSGRCVVDMPGQEPRHFSDGDFFFLAAPPVWTLGTSPALVPADFTRSEAHVKTVGNDKSGLRLRLLGGHFKFDDGNSALRRLLQQGAVTINGVRMDDPAAAVDLDAGVVLKSGARTWHRITRQ